MAEDPSGWSLTESDPQVFTQLLKDLGVKGLQVDDLYSLDSDTLGPLRPIHALIFLFKYVGGDEGESSSGIEVDSGENGVWFANQVINNSCGTLAALNAVMNIPPQSSEHPSESIELGPELENLRDFGSAMGPLDLGHTLSSHPLIREVHNSFSKSSPFSMDPAAFPEREREDAYHFVAYLPVNGVLYELDGLRRNPIMHAAVEDDWLDQARETIEARIATYPAGSLMFNLLAVRSDPLPRLTRLLNDPTTATQEKMTMQDQLYQERTKNERGAVENTLRRNNLLPVVFELFKTLGQSGKMGPIIEEARAKGRTRRERAKQRGEDED
ncbi:ubiquitin-specific protease [Kockovaella imperatae]|uniref:Ubiquitin carboxyl-terminal hydrolase n=1 Tax=Kockovaella imperatae TaxID=4999 RepID=A0A1Y1U8Q0_9TREE|nr:ubiquitin-specific protease [Kockovaella imperatae]ORX34420.1 ubiquitin-specific protease [Kockovaella imperatae]